VTMQEIFTLERRGVDADRNVITELVATGIRPRLAEKLRQSGVELRGDLFEPHARVR
jgi:pilus assembly protein CpaF